MTNIIHLLLFLILSLNLYADSPLYPSWLKYSLKITSEFPSQIQQEGYGIVINDGLILTSAEVVYHNDRAKNILVYNTEVLGESITCLAYARIIALDTNLNLAILEPKHFTDIYCNPLPELNFRSITFKTSFLDLLKSNTNPLQKLDNNSKISFFRIHDWLELRAETIKLKDFFRLIQTQQGELLGMPLFVRNTDLLSKAKEDSFIGIANSNHSLLNTQEILEFICSIHQKTSIFTPYPSINNYCH